MIKMSGTRLASRCVATFLPMHYGAFDARSGQAFSFVQGGASLNLETVATNKGRAIRCTDKATDDGIQIPLSIQQQQNWPFGSEDRTFCALVRQTSDQTSNQTLFVYGDDAAPGSYEVWRFTIDTGNPRIVIQSASYQSSLSLTLDQWHFVSCSLQGTLFTDHTLRVDRESEAATGGSVTVSTQEVSAAALLARVGGENVNFLGDVAIAAFFRGGEPWIHDEFMRNPWQIFSDHRRIPVINHAEEVGLDVRWRDRVRG